MVDPTVPDELGGLRLGNLKWIAPNSAERIARRRRRRFRRQFRHLRRFLFTVIAVGVICGMVFGGLLLIVPGVGDAPAVAKSLDLAHHAPYPGPVVPSRFSLALVAGQDRTFFSEPEPLQVSVAFFGGLLEPSTPSRQTLYQRVASMLYLRHSSGALAGVERSILGIKLELTFSRIEIMRMYAAVTYFGRGHYGLWSASCGYFGRPPGRLSWAQAAMLAAMAGAPSADDPYAHAGRARAAEAVILRRLVTAGVLSQAAADRAYSKPLGLLRRPTSGKPAHRRHHGRRRDPVLREPGCRVHA